MHLELLVEEPSAEAALRVLVPKIRPDVSFAVHPHQGKPDLLSKLPVKLRAYRHWLPQDWRIVVLVDRDRDDCRALKADLERAAAEAGFDTRSSARPAARFHVLNRMAIEELEAWYFGDVEALACAYPRVSRTLGAKRPYRDPDAIAGGTWEALQRVLQRAGYYRQGLPKIEAAQRVSEFMDPARNSSTSFQVFRDGLVNLA